MKRLNEQYLGVESTTDVLSFPQISDSGLYHLKLKQIKSRTKHSAFRSASGRPNSEFVLGDIVINVHKAKRQAVEYKVGFYDEIKKLLVHGLLHLIHYDHETSQYYKKKMKAKEKELLEKLRRF